MKWGLSVKKFTFRRALPKRKSLVNRLINPSYLIIYYLLFRILLFSFFSFHICRIIFQFILTNFISLTFPLTIIAFAELSGIVLAHRGIR